MHRFSLMTLIAVAVLAVSVHLYAQVTFIERPIDPFRNELSGIWAADLDNDGDKDLVVCEERVNRLVVWKNEGGTPLVWSRNEVGNGVVGPLYVCVGDIDGDGWSDVVASSGVVGSVSWWRNDGGAPSGWLRQDIQTGFTEAHAVYIADINGDGVLDVVGTASALNQVAWWKNSGGNPIIWTKQAVSNGFNYPQTAMAADIDNDGRMDIVAGSSYGDQVAWWRNGGGDPIVWTRQIIGSEFDWAHWIYACDIDSDSLIDVVGAAYNGGEIAWWQNGGGSPIVWTKQTIQYSFACALTVHAGDINNDGAVDVVATATCGTDDVAWWENSGEDSITWIARSVDANYNGGWPVFVADLDGDGDQDVVAGSDTFGGGLAQPLTWWDNRLIVHLEVSNDSSWGWYSLPVNFQGITTHNATSWVWDFGDGDSAFVQSPSHTYEIPGTYDVSLKMESPDTVITLVIEDGISVLADSINATDAAGSPSDEVEVVVEGVNHAPLRKLTIPIEYSGPLWLKLQSFSIEGCRTSLADSVRISYSDTASRRVEFTVFNSDNTKPILQVGKGPLLKLTFRIAGNASAGGTTTVRVNGYTGHTPYFYAPSFQYTPVGVSGVVSLTSVCGDANADFSVDISDAVYLIAFIFSGGPAPTPNEVGDVNCDGAVDISDAVYLIAHIFSGGPPPCASCK